MEKSKMIEKLKKFYAENPDAFADDSGAKRRSGSACTADDWAC